MEVSKRWVERPKHQWVLTPRRFLSDGEIKALRGCARNRASNRRWRRRSTVLEWIVIEIALETGLRVSEIAALRCGDVTLDKRGGSIFVRSGKGGKSRLVRFGGNMGKSLSRYLDWKHRRGESLDPDAPLLFSTQTRRTMTSRALQKMFSRVAKTAGVEGHTFHSLRHTFASHLYRASGNNLRLVQKQLGHASVRTTEIYADVLDGETEKAVNRLYEESR